MEEQRIAKAHKLVVNNRKTSMVTGVLDVLSFDLNEILLETEQGMLMVKGTDLHVNRLSVEKGEVDLSGNRQHCLFQFHSGRESRRKFPVPAVPVGGKDAGTWSRGNDLSICRTFRSDRSGRL